MTYTGLIQRKKLDEGSKSEREATVLVSAGTEYVLRRRGGNPFEVDETLDDFVGKEVECDGVLQDFTLIFDSCRLAP